MENNGYGQNKFVQMLLKYRFVVLKGLQKTSIFKKGPSL